MSRPTYLNESEKLELYALYNQATEGDNNSVKPALLNEYSIYGKRW